MKKHLNKLIIGIAFVLVFASGILLEVFLLEDTAAVPVQAEGEDIDIPEDYVISKSVELLTNENNYVHTDETMVKGTLEEIVYAGENLDRFSVKSIEDEEYEISISSMELISADEKNEAGAKEVELAFRTGEKLTVTEGERVILYKTDAGLWSFDIREHIKSDEVEFRGVVDDFVFLPTTDQKGDVYISHIIFKNDDDETVMLYPHNMNTNEIESDGEMRVFYAGSLFDTEVFDIEESKDFSLKICTEKYDYILEKGKEVKLVKKASTGYWELDKEIDTAIVEAEVSGFVFGHDNYNVTSLDYINLLTDEKEEVSITVLQTDAMFAIPYGNYRKEFIYDGHDRILESIEPMEDWKMELYYNEETILEISIGTRVAIYKTEDDIWVMDYTYEFEEEDEET